MSYTWQTVVIDNGSCQCKSGFADDHEPSSVIDSCVAYPKEKPTNRDIYIGSHSRIHRGTMRLYYPISHGIINDWNDIEKIWRQVFFKELQVDPSEFVVLMTDPLCNSRANRERTMQLVLETFDCRGFYLCDQSVLSLYSAGLTTGLVCDIGGGTTSITPVYEGYSIPHACDRLDIAGKDLTDWLKRLLLEKSIRVQTSAELAMVDDIREKHAYVALDMGQEQIKPVQYMTPSGNEITLGDELFRCPEPLFRPSLIGMKLPGIDRMVDSSIMKCDREIHNDMSCNILCSGGCSLIRGLKERLENSIAELASPYSPVRVSVHPDPINAAWLGGAHFASLDIFPQIMITQAEYDEVGPAIVHRRCFQ